MHYINNQVLTDVRSTPIDPVGGLIFHDSKVYRMVKNAETVTALTVGQVCCHTLTDTDTIFESVKIPLTANLGVLAGVVMAASLAAGSYGWIQVLGVNTQVSISGATTGGTDIAAGDFLKAVNSATYVVRDNATGASVYPRNIQALEPIGTTTTPAAALKKAYVRCLQ